MGKGVLRPEGQGPMANVDVVFLLLEWKAVVAAERRQDSIKDSITNQQ